MAKNYATGEGLTRRELLDGIRERRRVLTVGADDCRPGRGSCVSCDALLGNYHAGDCPRFLARRRGVR
jgi:hypothetical protein